MRRHLIIPDTQDKPGVPQTHWSWLGHYIADKRPEVIIHLGDATDLQSLSYWDKKKKSAEVSERSYQKDLDSLERAMDKLHAPWVNAKYDPVLIFCRGNHEQRYNRYIADNPEMRHSLADPANIFRDLGWKTNAFLSPVKVDGILYAHYFTRTSTGNETGTSKKYGASNATLQLKANMTSCTAGHKPGFDYKMLSTPRGPIHGLIAGSFYQHKETAYRSAQGSDYWRGVVMKYRVRNGDYDIHKISIGYLKEKYG